jgi:phosphoglycerate dehydrogenase-like enzyme
MHGTSLIVVHPGFDKVWPFAADHFRALWEHEGPVTFVRLGDDDGRAVGDVAPDPANVRRLAALRVPLTAGCATKLANLREATFSDAYGPTGGTSRSAIDALVARGVKVYRQPSEGFWGQSVAEFGLALTLCGLRRIPQAHHQIITDPTPWDYDPPGGRGRPGARGHQYGDDPRFTNGTLAGKRVRVVGAGNIASRYASFCHALGADVAAWDPFASEPCFHRAGARREWHLDRLVRDAEIFAPMVPLTDKTRRLVTAAHLDALPRGCLVVCVTRMGVVDEPALRRRVLADELALAADVFDVEPLPLDDPLLGRHNVVHTPHNAGRTRQANERWAEMLAEQFEPVGLAPLSE